MATYEHRMHIAHPIHKSESSLQSGHWFQSISSKTLSLFETFGHYLLNSLSQSFEPRIWQTQSQSGDTWWNVYDPITQQTVRLFSEMEVRTWLEQRY